ncbi:8702_t:CDS:2, partial [Dentiscutata erythropus]
TIIIDTPTSPVATGSSITISWGITEEIPTNPYVLEIINIDNEANITINGTLDLSVYKIKWIIDVEPGTYKFVIKSLDKSTTCSSDTFTVIIVSVANSPSLNSSTPSSQNPQNPQNSQNPQNPQNSQNSQNSQTSQISQVITTSYSITKTTSSPATSSTNNADKPETNPNTGPNAGPTNTGTNNSIISVNILGFIGITAGAIAGIMLLTTGSIMIARSRQIP